MYLTVLEILSVNITTMIVPKPYGCKSVFSETGTETLFCNIMYTYALATNDYAEEMRY